MGEVLADEVASRPKPVTPLSSDHLNLARLPSPVYKPQIFTHAAKLISTPDVMVLSLGLISCDGPCMFLTSPFALAAILSCSLCKSNISCCFGDIDVRKSVSA